MSSSSLSFRPAPDLALARIRGMPACTGSEQGERFRIRVPMVRTALDGRRVDDRPVIVEIVRGAEQICAARALLNAERLVRADFVRGIGEHVRTDTGERKALKCAWVAGR